MAKLDRIKEELGWLKVVFTVSTALDAALIAWLAHYYTRAAQSLVVLAALAVIAITAVIIGVNHAALRRFSALEDS